MFKPAGCTMVFGLDNRWSQRILAENAIDKIQFGLEQPEQTLSLFDNWATLR
jgi:hypothetical protein